MDTLHSEIKSGDLAIYCSDCNEAFVIEEEQFKNIEHGIVITPENYEGFKLVCPKCNRFMSLCFVNIKTKNEEKEEARTDSTENKE